MSTYYPGYAGGDYKGSEEMSEDEMMRKYAKAYGCVNTSDDVPNFGARWCKPKETFRPVPCVFGDHGAIKEQTVKKLFRKLTKRLTN